MPHRRWNPDHVLVHLVLRKVCWRLMYWCWQSWKSRPRRQVVHHHGSGRMWLIQQQENQMLQNLPPLELLELLGQ
jgi:hypothetical protein